MNAVLTESQKQKCSTLVAGDFDSGELGHTRFKVPELIGEPRLAKLSAAHAAAQNGHVVVVHFFAFGCINCIHNYPSTASGKPSWPARTCSSSAFTRPKPPSGT